MKKKLTGSQTQGQVQAARQLQIMKQALMVTSGKAVDVEHRQRDAVSVTCFGLHLQTRRVRCRMKLK